MMKEKHLLKWFISFRWDLEYVDSICSYAQSQSFSVFTLNQNVRVVETLASLPNWQCMSM